MSSNLISEEYKQLNRNFHHKRLLEGDPWGVSGRKYYHPTLYFAQKLGAKTILDYGCGFGTLKQSFIDKGHTEFDIREYDPCIPGKDKKRPEKADLVVSTDVAEHIEPEFLNNYLYEVYNRCTKGLFLVISTVSSKEWLTSEINAHRTVQPAEWWINKLLDMKFPITDIDAQEKRLFIWIERPQAKT